MDGACGTGIGFKFATNTRSGESELLWYAK